MSFDERELLETEVISALQETSRAPLEETLEAETLAPAQPVKAKPVESAERVASVDVIRGVAVLGILAMNIVAFAWPSNVYEIPILDPDAGSLDSWLWVFNHLIFDTKMVTLFSMLFGAGMVLMLDRAQGRGAKVGWVFYRRTFWLLVIGLVHSYFIWDGDILVWYASCGFFLFLFRRLRPRTLIITGICFNLIFVPLLVGFRAWGIPYMQDTSARVEVSTKAGEKSHWWDEEVSKAWKKMSKQELPKREDFLQEIQLHRGPYLELLKHRFWDEIWVQSLGFVIGAWWLVGGRMLIGMGLMKLGVFGAALSKKAYLRMLIIGYGVGLPLMAFDAYHQWSNGFFLGRRLWYVLDGWPFLTLYGSFFVVFGHIGAIMLICQSNAIPWLTRRLAAVGRMALSNYLFDSILCTTLFYGYGFDLFGTIHRPLLYLIVLAIWTFQLLVSPLWLQSFRFGPAEWLWRSLTYWKPQPMRLAPDTP